MNRKAQCQWAKILASKFSVPVLTEDAQHTDYILRMQVNSNLSDGKGTVTAIKAAAMQLLDDAGWPCHEAVYESIEKNM